MFCFLLQTVGLPESAIKSKRPDATAQSNAPRGLFIYKQLKILPATPAGKGWRPDVVVRDWFLRAMGGLPSCQCDWVEDSLADLHLKKSDAAPMHLMHIVRRITALDHTVAHSAAALDTCLPHATSTPLT